MNVALIHDKLYIKSFWEKRIDRGSQRAENEEQRMKRSALSKIYTFSSVPVTDLLVNESSEVTDGTIQTRLRDEWTVRLENRTKHLKNLNDNYMRKMKTDQT